MTTLAAQSSQKMPAGTISLLIVQLFSMISYAILYSSLALYCAQGLHLDDHLITSLIAMFVAFFYGLHLIGGFIGGRFLSYRSLFIISMLLLATGCYLISIPNFTPFYLGIALFLTGAGLNVTCTNCMLTQLFHPEDKRRERAFLWNYSSMNLGFCLSFITAGYFQVTHNYHDLFLISAFGNIGALLIVAISWSKLKDVHSAYSLSPHKVLRVLFGLTLMLALFFAVYYLVKQPTASQQLMIYGTLSALAFLLILSFIEKDRIHKQKMRAYLIFSGAVITFWTIALLGPNALILFLDRNIDRHFFSFVIPPQWFFNINPLMIILGGPPLAALFQKLRRKGYRITVAQQFSTALFLIGGGLLLIPIGVAFANADGTVPAAWITVCFTLQGIGELFIGPIGYAMVGQLAPPRLRGLMMGTWLMTGGMGGALAGIFSNWATVSTTGDLSPAATSATYGHVFLILGIACVAVAAILFLLRPLLDKLTGESEIKHDNETLTANDAAVAVS